MNFLTVDRGNTRVKAAIFSSDGKLQQSAAFSPEEAVDKIAAMAAGAQIKGSCYCTVAGAEGAALAEALSPYGPCIQLTADARLPVMNAYHSPETLGADRLAMVVAARAAHPDKNNMVIALGTCITYNFVTKQGTFRGGAISPGLRMRLQAMHHFTDRLPEVSLEGDLLLLGYDTPTCMRAGAVYGLAAEVHGMLQAYSAQYGEFNAILTGGDAAQIARQLKMEIFADPDLTLRGLYLILRHNVPHLR